MLYRQPHSRYWWIDYRVGARRVRKSTRCTSLEDAKQVEAIAIASIRRKLPADFIHALVDELYGRRSEVGTPCNGLWTAYREAIDAVDVQMTDKTLRGRQRACDAVARHFGGQLAEKLTPVEIRGYATALAKRIPNAKTRKNHLGDIITVMRALGIPSDGWRAVLPRAALNRLDCFTQEEERRILDAAATAGNHWRALCLISRHTGLREGDCVRLTWASVDEANQCLRIRPSKTAKHGIEVVLPIPADAWREIIADAAPRGADGDGRLFPDFSEHRPFRQVLEAAGVSGHHTFHSWRHTFRTRLSEAGVPDEIAMRLGGWTQRSTAARYDHAERLEDLRRAVESAAGI